MNNKEAIDLLLKSQIFLARHCGKTDMYNAVELAIKALEERPIDDLSEYSDKLWQKAYERGKAEARPQGEWILISERLPDYMDDILITFQKPNREPVVYRAVFIGSKFALDNGDVWNWNDPEIKAWTPLPEAYKEAENEDSN